jgi:heme-degrading monooxygenase HmoA
MYGTIARFTLKPGSAEEFGKVAMAQESGAIPGYVGTTVYHSDSNPDECWVVVSFEDRESYRKNADDPAQHQRYLELAQFFAKDPEWHDGEIVYSSVAATPVR